MATIVQSYNPWREQLLAGFLTPLLSNMIQKGQEANQVKKQNAFLGQLQQDIDALSTPQQSIVNPMSMGQLSQGTITSAPWGQNSLNAPLTQFDAGTSNLLSQGAPSHAAVTPAQIQQAIARNLAIPRFQMIDPLLAQKIAAPLLQSLELDRQEGIRKQLADNYINEQDASKRLDTMYGGALQGYVSDNQLTNAQKRYEFDNPQQKWQLSSVNAGDNIHLANYNPATGAYNSIGSIPVNMTPAEVANYGLKQRAQALDESEFTRKLNNDTYERNNPTLHLEKGNDGTVYAINPKTGIVSYATLPNGEKVNIPQKLNATIKIDSNNNYFLVDQNTGNVIPLVDANGETIKAQPKKPTGKYTLPTTQRIALENSYKRATEINKEINKRNEEISNLKKTNSYFSPKDEEYINNEAEISRLEGLNENANNELLKIAELQRKTAEDEMRGISEYGETATIDITAPAEYPPSALQEVTPQTPNTQRIQNIATTAQSPSVSNDIPQWAVNTPLTPLTPITNASADISPDIPVTPKRQPRPKGYEAYDKNRKYKNGETFGVEVPDDMYYNEERDKGINVKLKISEYDLTRRLSEIFSSGKTNYTPEEVLMNWYKQGYRVKRATK